MLMEATISIRRLALKGARPAMISRRFAPIVVFLASRTIPRELVAGPCLSGGGLWMGCLLRSFGVLVLIKADLPEAVGALGSLLVARKASRGNSTDPPGGQGAVEASAIGALLHIVRALLLSLVVAWVGA
jgi:hypothetical protein